MALKANYFPISFADGVFGFYQYDVKFEPDLSFTGLKKRILANYTSRFPGGFLFDGTTLRLRQKVRDELINITADNAGGSPVQITITYTKYAEASAHEVMQSLNLVCRSLMAKTQMTEIRRNFFNMQLVVSKNF